MPVPADVATVVWSVIASIVTIVIPSWFIHRVSMAKNQRNIDRDRREFSSALEEKLFARVKELEDRLGTDEKERYRLVAENVSLAIKAARLDDLDLRVVKLELENQELRLHNDHLEDQVRSLQMQLKALQP